MKRLSVALIFGLSVSLTCYAQEMPKSPSAPVVLHFDMTVSPEVHRDGQVIFRLHAPKANEVAVYGDWMPLGHMQYMHKIDHGVWTVTVGPLPPNLYSYDFVVDGVRMLDPQDSVKSIGLLGLSTRSLFEVPGKPPVPYDIRDVPHGAIDMHWYRSVLHHSMHRYLVYVPPGYRSSPSKKYPVLFLLHGGASEPLSWLDAGRVNFIMDNLLAEGKARPMLIVMPYGQMVPANLPPNPAERSSAPAPQPAFRADLLAEDILKTVLPEVEREYRVSRDPNSLAVAGFSMGGAESQFIGLSYLAKFHWIGIFDGAWPQDFVQENQQLLAHPGHTNSQIRLLFIGCGNADPLALQNSRELDAVLTAHHIAHRFQLVKGAHDYISVRQLLAEFLGEIFRPRKARDPQAEESAAMNVN